MTATASKTKTAKPETKVQPRASGKINFRAVGRALGASSRRTLESTALAHKAWAKANDETKKVMEIDFMIGVVGGELEVTNEVAESYVLGSRPGAKAKEGKHIRTAEQQKSFDRARHLMTDHLKRTASTRGANGQFPGGSKNPYKKGDERITEDFKAQVSQQVTAMYGKLNATNLEDYAYAILAWVKSL